MFSFSFWSKITSKWLTWDSASATRRVLSLSSSRLLDGKPLLCNISSSFLMDSSRALRVCFCVSILSSISSKVFLNRNSSLACRSCSACSRRKFSSVSSMVKCSAPRLPLSCCRRWLRSLWVRSSSWRAWIVNCRCCDGKMGRERRQKEKSQWPRQGLCAGPAPWRWNVNHEVHGASLKSSGVTSEAWDSTWRGGVNSMRLSQCRRRKEMHTYTETVDQCQSRVKLQSTVLI